LKQSLKFKGIVLGILLLLMAIASTVAVFQLRANRSEHSGQAEQP